MQKNYLTLLVSLVACLNTFAQQTFKTSKGLNINLDKNGISVNGKNLYPNNIDFLPDEPAKLIESGNTVFLFVPYEATPNTERMTGFRITDKKIDSVVNAPSSDIKDLDGDSYPEFGGIDIGESIPEGDSMYYIASEYYEIKDGKVLPDTAMAINTDVRTNGVYMRNPSDKLIPAPYRLTDPLIISERIDGPANIRDAANTTVLFSLNDRVPVVTAETKNKRYQIGITVDITPAQAKSKTIEKGSKLYVKGQLVGTAGSTIPLTDINKNHAELSGYTAIQNIRKNTLPEEVLASIIRYHTAGLEELTDFIKGYQLSKGDRLGYTSFTLNESPLYGPSAPMRIELLFEKNKLFGIIHTRKLPLNDVNPYDMDRGFFLTIPGYQPKEKVLKFIKQFNEIMQHAG
jgi:hypothetical protein